MGAQVWNRSTNSWHIVAMLTLILVVFVAGFACDSKPEAEQQSNQRPAGAAPTAEQTNASEPSRVAERQELGSSDSTRSSG